MRLLVIRSVVKLSTITLEITTHILDFPLKFQKTSPVSIAQLRDEAPREQSRKSGWKLLCEEEPGVVLTQGGVWSMQIRHL